MIGKYLRALNLTGCMNMIGLYNVHPCILAELVSSVPALKGRRLRQRAQLSSKAVKR